MSEPIEPPNRSNEVDRLGLPPLRIHHFLAWTAVLAGSLSLFGWSQLRPADRPGWAVAESVVSFVLYSAAATCVGFGIAWRLSGLRFPSEPGHWIAIQSTLGLVVGAVFAVLYGAYQQRGTEDLGFMMQPDWVRFVMRWISVVAGVLFGIFNVIVAVRFVTGLRWRLVFCTAAWLCIGIAAMQAFFFVFMQYISRGNTVSVVRWLNVSVDAVPTSILLLLLVVACIHDRRMHYVRHWSHWVGVAVWSIGYSITILRYVAAYFLGEL